MEINGTCKAGYSGEPVSLSDEPINILTPPGKNVTLATVASSIAMVSSFWKDFDLETLRGKLDEEGLQIAENQELSVKKRRELADATREFRKKEFSQKDVAVLLRSYQDEIDRVTRRCEQHLNYRAKFAETSFLALYQKLYEAPDPAHFLAAATESLSLAAELESQVRKMSHELAEFKAESKCIKNQEVTIKKLQEEIRALQAALEEKDRQLSEAIEETKTRGDSQEMLYAKDREEGLTTALSEAHENLRALRDAHAATQNALFQITSQSEEETAGLSRQLEIAAEEMERAEERYLNLQQEKSSLLATMRSLQNGGGEALAEQKEREKSLRDELRVHRERSSYLQSELAALHRDFSDQAEAHDSQMKILHHSMAAQRAETEALRQELMKRPTPEELELLRQQVRALHAVGFSHLDGEVETGDELPTVQLDPPVSLESMLLDKNRHLEHQLTRCKLDIAELRNSLEASTQRGGELESELQQKTELIELLEESVASLNTSRLDADGSGAHPVPIGMPMISNGSEEQTMIAVVVQQRDRFRKRCLELEEAVSQGANEVLAIRSKLQAAKSDNAALMERMKYLKGFGTGAFMDMAGGVAERRYASDCEAQLNPFSHIQARQDSQRRKTGLPERAVYILSSIVASNKYARLFVFLYAVLLHVVIFASIFRISHMSHHEHVATETLCSKQLFLQHSVDREHNATILQ